MKRHNFKTVVKFEVLRSIKKITFWISALSFPILIGIIVGISMLSANMGKEASDSLKEENFTSTYYDDSKIVDESVAESLGIEKIADKDFAIKEVKDGKKDMFVYLPSNLLKDKIEIYAKDVGVFQNGKYSSVVNVLLEGSSKLQVSDNQQAVIAKKTSQVEKTYKDGKEYDAMAHMIVPGIFLVLFYIVIAVFGSRMLTATSEEKENRVIEMLLTTVESKVLLSGKIISLVILGLLQCMVIIIPILFGFFILKSAGTIEGLNIPNIVFEPGSFLLSFCFFALSYLLYAGILLTVGSAMPTAQEASSYVGVFMMFLFMPLYMVQALVSTPDALISKFLTFFPLTSPIPLLIRNTVGNLSTSDTIIALVIMLISVFVVLKLSVIAFKNGSLQYSRKLKLKELLKSS